MMQNQKIEKNISLLHSIVVRVNGLGFTFYVSATCLNLCYVV
jgi:hypothetical protein